MMKKFIAFTSAALLLLGACSTDSAATDVATESPDITLGLTYIPDVQFAPVYVAEEKGYFEDAGVDVTVRHHGAQEALFGALVDGKEDIVFAGGDEMMQARDAGVDVVNWATLYQTYPVSIIVPSDAGITDVAQLAGYKIGVPGEYGQTYFGLLALLEDAGLTDKVSVVSIGYTQASALRTGEVDAIAGFINNDAVALEAAGIDVDVLSTGADLPLVGVGFGSLAKNIEPNTDAYAKLLSAVEQGVTYARENPEETLDIVAEYEPSLKEAAQRDVASVVLDKTLDLYEGGDVFGEQDVQRWSEMSEFLTNIAVTKQPVPAEEAYTTAIVDATK